MPAQIVVVAQPVKDQSDLGESLRASRVRNSQNLWIGVSRGFLINSLASGSFDEFVLLEPGAGADEGD